MEDENQGQSKNQFNTSNSVTSIRQKKDLAWKYVRERMHKEGRYIYICTFCQKQIASGEITRMKEHLTGTKGNIDPCKKVSAEAHFEIRSAMDAYAKKAKEKRGEGEDLTLAEENELKVIESERANAKGKRKASISSIESFFKKGISDFSQPSIKACLKSKENGKILT